MKKLRLLIVGITVTFMFFALSLMVLGAENEYICGVFTYTVTDGEATITGCDSNVEGHLVIPETLDGYTVSRIESRAFINQDKITDITIPDSVKSMGKQIFNTSLENVYTVSLDSWFGIAFEGILSNPLGAAENLYIGGELITDLVIPEGITGLPDYAFYGCDSITSVTLPKSLKLLGEWTFSYCDNMKSVYADSVEWWINLYENTQAAGKELHLCSPIRKNTNLYFGGELLVDLVIPESVTTLPPETFERVRTIESITFHEGITSVGGNAFVWCDALKEVYVPNLEVWFNICEIMNRNAGKQQGIETIYINNEPVIDLVIPEDIDTIVDDAFFNYKKLRSITFTSPIKQFGEFWAYGCENFEAIYVDSFETWNACEFDNALENPLYMVDYLYIDGKTVIDLVIPEGTASIAEYTFYGYRAIKSVTIPQSVNKIGAYAFPSYLENVYVESLESWISLCASMVEVSDSSAWHPMQYAENLYIGGEMPVNLVIPESITEIPKMTFYNVKSIESVAFHKNITKIGKDAFLSCFEIRSYYVPDMDFWFNFNKIFSGKFAPYGLENLYVAGELLTEYTVSEGVTALSDYAFAGYSGLKRITFSESLKSVGTDAFKNCVSIESVYAPSLEYWLSVDFVTEDSNPCCDKTKLYLDGELLENLRIPENIGVIKPYTFFEYYQLKNFYITGSPLKIGYNAFSTSCKGMNIYADTLEDWFAVNADYYPSTYSSLMYLGAVLNINGEPVEEITIPESITKIPSFAFEGCKTLKKITIPLTTEIGRDALSFSGLKEIVFGSLTEKTEAVHVIDSGALNDCYVFEKITFGYGVKSIPKRAFTGKKCLKEVVFYDGIERIGTAAFHGTGLENVSLPSSLKTVEKSAFGYCRSLKSVTLGDASAQTPSMEIADEAFYYCAELESVTIGSGVKSVGKDVFLKSEKLNHVYIDDLPGYLAIEFAEIYNDYSNPVQMADYLYIDGEIATDVVIPEGVTSICKNAFAKCLTLESVEFPSTLIEIGDSAFEGCYYLKDVDFPESLKIIGDSAFYACNSLTKLELGKNVSKIGVSGFGACSNIKIIYMYPEQLSIRRLAFWDCDKIEVVLYTGTEEAWLKLLDESKRETGLENIAVFYRYRPESMLAPEGFTAKPSADSVALSWTNINGVTGYRVFVKKDSGWKALKTTNKNTYTATQLQTGTKYTFAVKAYINTGALVLWSPNYSVVDTATQTIKPSKVTAAQNSSAIKLTWAKCNGATGYRIYFKSGNMWKIAVSTTSATAHTFTGLKPGSKFTFAIRPYIINGSSVIWSPYTEFTTATTPSSVTAKASSPSKGSLSLSWNAVNGADGYRVYYKVGNGSYKLYKTYSTVQNLTFRNLKSGTKYTFAVRAGIRTSGGNIFGGYNTATVTVK